jgi:RNA polymerase sigma factor (sigma-70 family)
MASTLRPDRYVGTVPDAADDPRSDADAAATAAWVAGDPDALRLAWERFGPMVFTYCVRRLSDRDAASDCTQETFVGAWRSRDRFDPASGTLAGWLMGIARFKVLDAFRSASRTPSPIEDPPDRPATTTEPADVLSDRVLVAHALDALPERARAVVELAFWSDLSQTEIAERLGVPLGTVKSDMRRGLTRMRDHLDTIDADRGWNP